MSLTTGSRIGPYEVTALIGEGGMGKVWRAHHAALKRDDALKVLPDAFASDPDRLARFRREAQVLASLNHPNIAHVYGLEQSDGVQALVMELVEGPTLADRIAQGPMPVDEALPIAKQITEALEAAHEQGIIHRDLKPANIKVRPDGTVKVLDFGLAKALEPTSAGRIDATTSPTITSPAMMTGVGVLLGTAAYMSPEQAKGRAADKRTDVWAFGCVLYEMLVGRRPFDGDDVSDTLAAILRDEPDWILLPAETSAGVRSVLRHCLEKDRKKRLRDIGDAGVLIDESATSRAISERRAGTSRREQLAWALTGLLVIGLIALSTAFLRQPQPTLQNTRFSVSAPEGLNLVMTAGLNSVVLSPDGRAIVFVATRGGLDATLWIRYMDASDVLPLAGTENATYPFWSPDSRTIGFFAGGALKTISASGGPVRTLCTVGGLGRGGTWNRDGTIVFAAQSLGLFSIPAAGGTPTQVNIRDENPGLGSRFPWFLPDQRHFLYSSYPLNEIRIASLDSDSTTKVVDAESQAQFVAPGYLLFVRQSTLLAQRFDAERGITTGTALPILDRIGFDGNGYSPFSGSDSGALAYRSLAAADITQLVWTDRNGKPLGVALQPGRYRNPLLSPDSTQMALEIAAEGDGNRDIWLLELRRGVLSRLTFDPDDDVYPVWSPDGSRIAFGSNRQGRVFSIYAKQSNGGAADELVFKSTVENAAPYSWSPDGQFILHRYMSGGAFNFGVLPVTGGKSRLFEAVPFTETVPQVSPDGRWVAYHSNESGRYEVFVQTFPQPGGKWQISKDGGFHPKWRSDGRELYYYAADGQLMAVPTRSAATLEVLPAAPLFMAQLLNGPSTLFGFRAQYDVTGDGQRFLLNVPTGQTQSPSIDVILNWPEVLRK